MTLPYHSPCQSGDNVYSIDRIVLIFFLESVFVQQIIENETAFQEFFPSATTTGINNCCNQYRQTFNMKVGYTSVTIKLLHNGSSDNRCYFECNPNKCFDDPKCKELLDFILSRSVVFFIRRFDLAIDILRPRHLFRFDKDRRHKVTYATSKDNHTEYLGKRNKPGHCCLYDKQRESKLDYPCTRVEITLENPLREETMQTIQDKLPKVKVRNDQKISLDYEKLSSTDRVLIDLFSNIENIEYKSAQFKNLDWKKQQKLKEFIYTDEVDFIFDISSINHVINCMITEIQPEYYAVDDVKFINTNYILKEESA